MLADENKRNAMTEIVDDVLQAMMDSSNGQQVYAVGYIKRYDKSERFLGETSWLTVHKQKEHFDGYVVAPRAELAVLAKELGMWKIGDDDWEYILVIDEPIARIQAIEAKMVENEIPKFFDTRELRIAAGDIMGMEQNQYNPFLGGGKPWHLSAQGVFSSWSATYKTEQDEWFEQKVLDEKAQEEFLCEVIFNAQQHIIVG